MSSISFDNIYLIFLAIPLIVLFTVPFVLAVRKDNRNGHNIASFALHIVMALVIAFAATTPTITTVLTQTEVYVVADVSYSARKNLDTMDNYIRNLKLPSSAKLGLVVFGNDYELVNRPDNPSKIASVKGRNVDISGTDITGALEYTGTLFSNNVLKRIVLITDGRDSDLSDGYALKRAVDKLEMQNIKVDAIYLDDNIPEGSEEVQLSYVEYTQNAYLAGRETVNAVVQSGTAANAILNLYRGEKHISRRAVSLEAGVNNIAFDLDTSEAGSFDYRITVESEKDTSELNNACSFTQTVSDELRVLFISGIWEQSTAAAARYGEKVTLDIFDFDDSELTNPLKVLEKNQFKNRNETEKLKIYWSDSDIQQNFPFSIEALCKYDEIVLSDVDIMTLPNYTEFVRCVDTVVSAYGKSFITLGNLGIQNREYIELKQLEDMLPVRFGNSDNDPRIFTLVIDASRSMEMISHLIVAKQVSKALVNLLKPDDQLCIVTFAPDVKISQAPKPLREFAEGEISEILDNIDAEHGTLIGKGLQKAYEFLVNLESSDKQVMLFTDGLTYSDEADNPIEVARNMYGSGIVTSVFDVGRQGDRQDGSEINPDPTATAAKEMLKKVAEEGHGKYFYSNNLENMDEVTFGQIADVFTESVIERETPVTIQRRTDDILENIITDENGGITGLPDVSGYVYGTAKASANTVLAVEHERGNGTVAKPLYAYWKYGNGKVACFTSGFEGDWIQNWTDAGISEEFFDNLIDTNIPAERHVNPFTVTLTNEGKYTSVMLTPGLVHYGVQASVEVTLPDGTKKNQQMSFNASYYYALVDTSETGRYEFAILYDYNTVSPEIFVVHVDYKTEYDEFAVYDASQLHRALDGRGTVSTDGVLDLRNIEDEVGKITVGLAIPLFILCAVLYLADVVIRKLKWEDITSFFGLNKDKRGKKS